MQSDAPFKISDSDLEKYSGTVSNLLDTVSVSREERITVGGYAPSSKTRMTEQTVKIIERARAYGPNGAALLPDMVNHTMHVLHRAVCIGIHISELYKTASGLDLLIERNKREDGFQHSDARVEFNKKNETSARITRFVIARYMLWELAGYHADSVDSVQLPQLEDPAIDDRTTQTATKTTLFYFGDLIERLPEKTAATFVKAAKVYFESMLDEIAAAAPSLAYTEPFMARSYKLEKSDFVVHGFSTEMQGVGTSAVFKRLSFEEIVGNRAAKHEAKRNVFRICCYDPTTQKNPFQALTGTLQSVRLGYGVPGTGKSMQIAATATAFQDLCDLIGIPFVYNPLDGTVVSTFQGGSAERMKNWFSVFDDAGRIVYAPIDDAEQVLQDRTMQGVSAGVREVISQFLTGTEGAGAHYMGRGSVTIETYTNLPEQIDPAVMSRHQARFPIDGARRWEDFLDQDYLWWQRFADTVPEFVANMSKPEDYGFMSLQGEMESLSEALDHYTSPRNATMQTIFEQVMKDHDPTDYRFYAELATAVQAKFPKFSSRETRNIQSAISARMVDFDAPDTWTEDPEEFFRQDYEQKLAMLKELMVANMGNLRLEDIWVQEYCRYLDSFAEIEEQQFRRDVAARVRDLEVMAAAQKSLG